MKEKLTSIFIRALASTWRFRVVGSIPQESGVVAFWHGRMLPLWKFFANHHCVGVTSLSKDGDILARLLSDWRYTVVRGSSSRGGKELLEQITQLASSKLILITPDGPRGPVYEFKPGAILCAQRSKTTLVFCDVKYSFEFVLRKSWDNFSIPLPFSTVILHFHKSIVVNESADREEIDRIIQSLNDQFATTRISNGST